jgi:hypothetical protein
VIPPVYFDFMRMMRGERVAPFDLIKYSEKMPTRLLIVRKDGAGKPVTVEQPPGMVFHNGNAFEQDGQLVIALRFWFGGQFTWRSFLLNVFTILLFSNCIGMLIAVSISLAARRLPSKRSLPGLLLLALLIAAAAALGCVVASSLVIVFGLYSPGAFFVIVGRSRASVRICSSTRSTRSPR